MSMMSMSLMGFIDYCAGFYRQNYRQKYESTATTAHIQHQKCFLSKFFSKGMFSCLDNKFSW